MKSYVFCFVRVVVMSVKLYIVRYYVCYVIRFWDIGKVMYYFEYYR